MSIYSPKRDSQCDGLIPVSFDHFNRQSTGECRTGELSSYATYSNYFHRPSPTSPLGAGHGSTLEFWQSSGPFTPAPAPPPLRSWTFESEAAVSDVSQPTSPPGTPLPFNQPASVPRHPSPFSDKEATPAQPSYLSAPPLRHLHSTHLDSCEKEVVPHSSDSLYSAYSAAGSLTSHPSSYPSPNLSSISGSPPTSSSPFGQPLAYSDTSLAYSDTTLAHTDSNISSLSTSSSNSTTDSMGFFRRRPQSQALNPQPIYSPPTFTSPPPRTTSPCTMDEKRTLEPQDTGVVQWNGTVGSSYGSQDTDKQPLYPGDASISSQIALARSTRIRAVVDRHLEPILRDQALNGISETSILLVPEPTLSSSTTTPPSYPDDSKGAATDSKPATSDVCRELSAAEAASYSSDLAAPALLHVVRMAPARGDGMLADSAGGSAGDVRALLGDQWARFWQQPAVLAELDRLLRIRLVAMGLELLDPLERAVGGSAAKGGALPPSEVARRMRGGQKWHGHEWTAAKGIWETEAEAGGRKMASWQDEDDTQVLMPGQASVAVRPQKVAFRSVNEMGLFEPVAAEQPGIVVRVAIEVVG